jgi:hypothetical protein
MLHTIDMPRCRRFWRAGGASTRRARPRRGAASGLLLREEAMLLPVVAEEAEALRRTCRCSRQRVVELRGARCAVACSMRPAPVVQAQLTSMVAALTGRQDR